MTGPEIAALGLVTFACGAMLGHAAGYLRAREVIRRGIRRRGAKPRYRRQSSRVGTPE